MPAYSVVCHGSTQAHLSGTTVESVDYSDSIHSAGKKYSHNNPVYKIGFIGEILLWSWLLTDFNCSTCCSKATLSLVCDSSIDARDSHNSSYYHNIVCV